MSDEASQDTDSGKSGDDAVITPGKPVQHVDTLDGSSAGHHIEPEIIEGSTGNDVSPGHDGAPPTAADAPPNEPPPKTTREEIYAKAQTGRSAEMDEDMAAMTEAGKAEHIARLNAEAGAGEDPFAAVEPTETPTEPAVEPTQTPTEPPVVPTETAAPPVDPAATPTLDQQNAAQGIDPAPEKTTITVYGMTEEVPTADVVAAGGISNYQKNRAADVRMERMATYEASLRNYEQQLSERAAGIERRGEQPPAQPGTGITESSPTDAQGNTVDVNAQAEQLAGAIYSGDRDEATSQIKSVLTSIQSEAIRAAQASVVQPVASGPSQAAIDAEANARREANTVFLNEFKELNTPVLKKAALDMVQTVAADPIMSGRPLSEITREACTRVREDVFRGQVPETPAAPAASVPSTPLMPTAPTPTVATQDLGQRLELKRRTVVTPINEAHGRVATAPEVEEQFPSNSEFVNKLRKGRGQPA